MPRICPYLKTLDVENIIFNGEFMRHIALKTYTDRSSLNGKVYEKHREI